VPDDVGPGELHQIGVASWVSEHPSVVPELVEIHPVGALHLEVHVLVEDITDTARYASGRLQTYLDDILDRPDWARLFGWRSLGDDPGHGADGGEDDAAHRQRLHRGVRPNPRARQRDGELTGEVSAEFVMLLAT
jgi:hypothetical protein